MNVLDLFSGIGGFSLGLERAGMRTVAFCEIDPYCQRVIAKHWPGAEINGDITQRGFVQGEADVITAGFPCQDISLAGDGAGLAGARSGLYRHVIRAIRLVRPKYAVLENVAALLGRGLGTVLGDMAEVGYDAEWHCIPASAVGAPHRRDRIWIIANPGGQQHESCRAPFSGEIASELLKAFVADTTCELRDGGGAIYEQGRRPEFTDGGEMGNAHGARFSLAWNDRGQSQAAGSVEARRAFNGASWWSTEPNVGRVANGVPSRVDRLRSLGNSVVPQIPEIIGRAILASQEAIGDMR